MEVMKVEKAGMSGVDKDRISKVIAENTGRSYSSFTAKQQQRLDLRVKKIKEILSSVSASDMARSEKEADDYIVKLEASRDLSRHCVHIDMDAFFAAVEMRDQPRLRSVPMAVGSQAMLSTSNYIARRYGVRAAMPGFIGKKLCPELEIVPGNYKQYGKESKVFGEIFAEYDHDFCMGSLDEAYIDITCYLNGRKDPRKFTRIRFGGKCICRLPLITMEEVSTSLLAKSETCEKCGNERMSYEDEIEFGCSRAEVVKEIRFRVEQKTGLTCSAGIANNFMLAKICSDINKPNGQYELANDYSSIMDFLKTLPIRKVCGIGRVSEGQLNACGMETVGDILEKRASLKFVFTMLSYEHFLRVALGLSGQSRNGDSRRKSISVERTFSPTNNDADLKTHVQSICEELFSDIKKAGIIGAKCITLKIKLSSFDVLTRSVTVCTPIKTFEEILSYATSILVKELGQEMRLLGVRLSQLKFDDEDVNEKTVMDHFKLSNKRQKLEEDFYEDEINRNDQDSEERSCGTSSSSEGLELLSTAAKCPICRGDLPVDDVAINQHIDECLNRDFFKNENAIQHKPSITRKLSAGVKKGGKKPSKSSIPCITNFFRKSPG